MCHAMRRLLGAMLGLVVLSACAPPPRPFEHDSSATTNRRLPRDKIELAIGAPRNMPPEMGQRVAAALAMELQAYGIVATVQPADAPIQVSGTMSTRDAGETGIEIQIDWRIDGAPKTQDPQTSRTKARPEDYGEASERLVSRIAQQAAPRVATLIGKPPTFLARSPGQVAAGVSVPMEQPVDPVTATAMAAASSGAPPPASTQPCAAAGSARQGDGGAGDRRAVRRQPPALLRHAPRAGLEQDRHRRRRGRRRLHRDRQRQPDGDRRATRPARHQMAGQGPGRPQCRRPRTVQSGAARRDQGLAGPDSATLSQRRPPKACSNCSKRRSTGRVSEPIRKLAREPELACQRGVRDCYCPRAAARFLQRRPHNRETVAYVRFQEVGRDLRGGGKRCGAAGSSAGQRADPQGRHAFGSQDPRSDLDHRLHRQRNHGYLVWDTLFAMDEKFEVKPQMVDKYDVSADKLT